MKKSNSGELTAVEKWTVVWTYFFPTVFFSLASVYLLARGEEPQSFFLSNIFLILCFLLIPFFSAVCMFAAKFLNRDPNHVRESTSWGLGLLCFFFLLVSYTYQYHRFAADTIQLPKYMFSLIFPIIPSSLCGAALFFARFRIYAKNNIKEHKNRILWVCLLFPLAMMICAMFAILYMAEILS